MTKIIKTSDCANFTPSHGGYVPKQRAAQAATNKIQEKPPWVVACFYVGREEDPESMLYWTGTSWCHDATKALKWGSAKEARAFLKSIPTKKGYSLPIERRL